MAARDVSETPAVSEWKCHAATGDQSAFVDVASTWLRTSEGKRHRLPNARRAIPDAIKGPPSKRSERQRSTNLGSRPGYWSAGRFLKATGDDAVSLRPERLRALAAAVNRAAKPLRARTSSDLA